jgi:hypothetical protein
VTRPRESKSHGWLATGCLGAVVLGVTLVVVVAALLGVGVIPQPAAEDRQARVLERPLPAGPGGEFSASGTLRLDLAAPGVRIEAGAPGAPIRVEAEFDHAAFTLTDSFREETDGRWIHEIAFIPSFRGLRRALIANRAPPTLRVIVPRELIVDLDARIHHGRSELSLGGLSLSSLRVDFGQGNHLLRFDEANPVSMETLTLESTGGEIRVEEIGNASPAEVSVQHGLGLLTLDLGGSWRAGADLRADVSRFGNIEILAPDDRPLAMVANETGRVDVVDVPDGFEAVPEDDLSAALRLAATARNGSIRILR